MIRKRNLTSSQIVAGLQPDSALSTETVDITHLIRAPRSTIAPPKAVEIVQSLSRRSDLDLIAYCRAVLKNLVGNPDFPLLQSILPYAQEQVDTVMATVTEVRVTESHLSAAYKLKGQNRDSLERVFRTLGLLVQAESHGNPTKINGAGMRIKSKGTPTTSLPFPSGIEAARGPHIGTMKVTWRSVRRSRGYVVRISAATTPRTWTTHVITGKPVIILTDLEPGATYILQVATLGSEQGQSVWSPEITRICA